MSQFEGATIMLVKTINGCESLSRIAITVTLSLIMKIFIKRILVFTQTQLQVFLNFKSVVQVRKFEFTI